MSEASSSAGAATVDGGLRDVPPEVQAEFKQQLDQYAADYEKSLRDHIKEFEEGESPQDDDGGNDATESVDESVNQSLAARAGSLLAEAVDKVFSEVYP